MEAIAMMNRATVWAIDVSSTDAFYLPLIMLGVITGFFVGAWLYVAFRRYRESVRRVGELISQVNDLSAGQTDLKTELLESDGKIDRLERAMTDAANEYAKIAGELYRLRRERDEALKVKNEAIAEMQATWDTFDGLKTQIVELEVMCVELKRERDEARRIAGESVRERDEAQATALQETDEVIRLKHEIERVKSLRDEAESERGRVEESWRKAAAQWDQSYGALQAERDALRARLDEIDAHYIRSVDPSSQAILSRPIAIAGNAVEFRDQGGD